MKIIYVIDTLVTGGTEKSLLHITSRFKEAEAVIVTLFDKKHDLADDFRAAGVSVIELGIKVNDKLWLPKAVKKLNVLFNEHRPTIVHAHLYNGELAARLASKKAGYILLGAFVNDPYVSERLSQEPALRVLKIHLYKFLDKITAKRVAGFTSLTQAISSTNSKILGIPKSKIKVIPRGRPVKNFNVSHPDHTDEFRFLCVARLLKRKGYFDLISAAKLLKERGKNFKILAAGNGVDAQEIKHFAAANNVAENIEFLGNCTNIPELLAYAHCFVLPSHYEGMGAAVMEAMFAAKPLIVSDIDVFTEQIDHGKTGLVFKKMNAQDLADKMEWMIDNYAAGIEMGFKAREFALENFDIDKVAVRYEEYYKQLAGQTKSMINTKQTVVA